MNRPVILAAALAAAAAAGYLARCEAGRRRTAPSPRGDRRLLCMAGAVSGAMGPGETAETLTVAARAGDGGAVTYTMRWDWMVPTVAFSAPVKEKRR